MKICNVEGCNIKQIARGYCNKHYKRLMRLGDPNAKVNEINEIKESLPLETVICKQCGKDFRAKRDRRREHVNAMYCSKDCSAKSRMKQTKCVQCGTKYWLQDGYSKKYCTIDCRDKDNTKLCEVCGKEYVAIRPQKQRLCSEECRMEDARKYSYERDKNRHVRKEFNCAECSKRVITEYGEKQSRYCSDKCLKRSSRRMRRAMERASKARAGKIERVSPIEVLRRDGWRCQKCGIKTPQKYRGTTKDNAPEVDHITTLAEGGNHEYKNLQCLCRQCNIEKGARSWGQLKIC